MALTPEELARKWEKNQKGHAGNGIVKRPFGWQGRLDQLTILEQLYATYSPDHGVPQGVRQREKRKRRSR